MRIALLEPYDTGSHAAWLRGLQHHSANDIVPLSLTGQFWKWRMHGVAVTLARQALRQDGASVGAIAQSLGYASESAFGNAFKRMFGRSPKRYWAQA